MTNKKGKEATSAGMRLRRPTGQVPSDADIEALEDEAERLASKAPGSNVAFSHASPRSQEPAKARRKAKKVQITTYLPHEVREWLTRAAVALSGPPTHETVTSIVERAIRKELQALEDMHGEFPEAATSPRPGRRPG